MFHPRSIFSIENDSRKSSRSRWSRIYRPVDSTTFPTREQRAIFSLRGPSMSAFIALPSKSSGSATNTPASFRLGKQTKSSSRSVFPSFSYLRELSKPYIGSIGFPRERKNLCSEHWPPYRLFQLTIPSEQTTWENSYTRPTRSCNLESFLSHTCIFPKWIIHLRYLSATREKWLYFEIGQIRIEFKFRETWLWSTLLDRRLVYSSF